MVSQCAGCNVYEPWAAFIIGSLAGAVFIVIHLLMLKFKLDDPLDAVAVHAGGGILGVFTAPFFKQDSGIFWAADLADNVDNPGVIWGINVAAIFAIILWAGFWSCLLFGTLRFFGLLRIDSETEFKGCDIVS